MSEDKVLGKGLDALIPQKEGLSVLDSEDDVKRVLKVIDDLFGKLPENVVAEFANSKDFELYERVLKKYGLG